MECQLNLLNSFCQMMFHHNTSLKWKLVNELIVCYSSSLLHILVHLHACPYDICILWLICLNNNPKSRSTIRMCQGSE